MKMRLLLTLLCCLAGNLLMAQELDDKDPSLAWDDLDHEWFNKQRIADNDKDADGNLSWEEISQGDATLAYYAADATFADADRNGNGLLSLEEMRTFNAHEAKALMTEQNGETDKLIAEQQGSMQGLEPILTTLYSKSYYLNHHSDEVAKFQQADYANAHAGEAKVILQNKWYLAQHPKTAAALYASTELIWKRDPVLARWIRKHQAYMAEHR